MPDFPRNHNAPDIVCFEFISWSRGLYSYVHTGYYTPQEALENYRATHGNFIQTEIIVLPKKGRKKNRISHKLVHLEKDHPDTWFVAAVYGETFREMCEDADRGWQLEKEAARNRIKKVGHDTKLAELDNLPPKFRAQIRINDSGCWLWIPQRRRNARGNLRMNGLILQPKQWTGSMPRNFIMQSSTCNGIRVAE